MRADISVVPVLLAAVLSFSVPSHAQTVQTLPGCEAAPEVRKLIDDKLALRLLDRMKVSERMAYERPILEDLIAKYPRELEPYEILNFLLRQYGPDDYPAFRERLVKMAKERPDDPLALLLAGEALSGRNTPDAIRLIESAKAKAPDFPWPAMQLAQLYSRGKSADPDKEEQNIETFFGLCPGSRDGYALWLLRNPSVQAKIATALRSRLEKETDPKKLSEYETLWSLEFQSHPLQEHLALRAQVAKDVKRLEGLNPRGDAEWQALLIKGSKQSGAAKEAITAMEDRLLREYPHSVEAYEIVTGRWNEAHERPKGRSDAAAWAKYEKEHQAALKGWIREFPDNTFLQRYMWFDGIREDSTVSEKDGTAAAELYVRSMKDYRGPGDVYFYFAAAAQFLIERSWQPARAIEILTQARTAFGRYGSPYLDDDNITDEERKARKERQLKEDQWIDGMVLKAAMEGGRTEEALALRSSVETAPPQDKNLISGYWLNRARFEFLQKHAQDALAYYQLALQTRTDPPQPSHGILRDDLTDEARALWKAQGGTEAAWDVWSKPSAVAADPLKEGRWEKPAKTIPAFELADLSGKTWRLKQLEGKAVLINVWATWCGPCQAELPLIEKFYESMKNRSDIQVLTFSVDTEVGLVAPYLKDKGYTFPVLLGSSMSELRDSGIPQNWILDAQGISRWKQLGYDEGESYAEFEKDLLGRLEPAKGGHGSGQ